MAFSFLIDVTSLIQYSLTFLPYIQWLLLSPLTQKRS